MLLSDACTEYLFSCQVRRLSPKTIDNYRKQILYWQRYLDEVCSVQEVEKVRPIHIKNFISLRQQDHRKPAYINDLLKVFRSFYNYCVEESYVEASPLEKVKNVKQPKVIINTFTLTDIKRMIAFYCGNDFLSVRNRAILATFFDSGIRCAELMNLTDDKIKEDYMLIHGKGDKERVVPKSPFLSKCILRYQRARTSYFAGKLPPQGYTFLSRTGQKLTHEAVAEIVREAAKAAEVDKNVRASPHTCRHTFAQLQLKDGIDLYTLSRLMGHENIAVTQRYLRGMKDDDILQEGNKHSPLMRL